MRAYARKYGEDEEKWGVVGLIHDFDYERFPTIPEHTGEGTKILRARGWPEEIILAAMSHASYDPASRLAHGIRDELVRLSVGLESPADLRADLERALAVAFA